MSYVGVEFLVLFSALRGFPPGTPVFPSSQKRTFDLFQFQFNWLKKNYIVEMLAILKPLLLGSL